ncbi:hypothetical protein BDP81DRAFT_125227 [Colletotrichum phormii]|uniref:Uncharacterized protein n=1 Tax=Colletotrichum phormii TaxID=359342 RepID=A0AAI9ZZ83_9PEZI|nr:uncharacterized protein BDP81DRAFT_125227 [Colletotrichum phormii]KAK1640962.1 hypothetical protein BDP81DRAFT_125227 [Colletotrichum phormii]
MLSLTTPERRKLGLGSEFLLKDFPSPRISKLKSVVGPGIWRPTDTVQDRPTIADF